MTPIHLVQLVNRESSTRCVALVDEPNLRCLQDVTSVYELAQLCLNEGVAITDRVPSLASGPTLSYDDVYAGTSPWQLLGPIDVPGAPSRVLVAGTGLTHLGSARQRQAMHLAGQSAQAQDPDPTPAVLTDSMRMFQWGMEGGRPAEGEAGIAPEWFYKGDASVLRAPFEPLEIPSHAEDGGEEAEIAGIYLVAADGTPYRIGMCQGNEFSDHKFERRNYLNLAGSKLRACSLGPELVIAAPFADVKGEVKIERDGQLHCTRQLPAAKRTWRTRSPTSNTTTSNLTVIANPATYTSTTSAPTLSPSAPTSPSARAISRTSTSKALAVLFGTPSAKSSSQLSG